MKTVLLFRMSRYDSWPKKVNALSVAAERRGWRIQVVDQPAVPSAMRKLVEFWHPVGVIIAECWSRRAVVPFDGTPVVFFDSDPGCVPKDAPNVLHATMPICEAVVREFLSIGCTAVAYVGWYSKVFWSEDRIHHLREIVELHGLPFVTFEIGRTSSGNPAHLHERLCRWLRSIPRNCGVFAANDTIAESLFGAASAVGFAIPDDIAVMSVSDDAMLDERMSPTLTTLNPEYGLLAERAMRIIEGEDDFPLSGTPTMRLVRRQSTRRLKRRDADVDRALERIRQEASGGLSSDDVLAAFPCSRRMAEMRFKATTGQSVMEAIVATRVERSLELLTEGNMSIAAVSDRCGFPSPLVMRRQFAARMGMSPGVWRKKGGLASER